MSTQRETNDFWWWMKDKNRRNEFFQRKIWGKPYFWEDSVWKYLNRYLFCRIKHRRVEIQKDTDGSYSKFCFNCYREIPFTSGEEIRLLRDENKLLKNSLNKLLTIEEKLMDKGISIPKTGRNQTSALSGLNRSNLTKKE